MCYVSVLQLAKRLPPHFVPAEEYDALREEFMEYAVATDADLPAMDDGVDAFWSAMASLKTVAGHYKYSTISKLMKTYLLLPHSNADSERVFSMVNKICTEHRADLAQDTVAGVLSVKVNSRVDPQRFEPSRNELGKAKSATMEYNRLHLHPA